MPGRARGLLARRRVWLALGLPVAAFVALTTVASVSVFPPSITRKPVTVATASKQLYVMPPDALGNALPNYAPSQYLQQTIALADQLSSPEVRGLIAREAGIRQRLLAVDGPDPTYLSIFQREPSGEKRATQILVEGAPYRVTIDEDLVFPQIGVTAQAPTTNDAVKLALATQLAIGSYLTRVETSAQTSPAQRLEVQSLTPLSVSGGSSTGLVNVAGLAFLISLVLWSGLVIAATAVVRDVRSLLRPGRSLQVRGQANR